MIVIGLTGSIGMGKSTTAGLFAQQGVSVFDSDTAVHRLYEQDAVPLIEEAFPATTVAGKVDREKLGDVLRRNPANFTRLEEIVHPLVRRKQQEFLKSEAMSGTEFSLLDIPLLFETGAETRVDAVVVVTCAPDIQRQRVLARPGMNEEKLQMVLARQMPDEDKRKRADFIIDTGRGIDDARAQVLAVLVALRTRRDGKV